MTCTDSRSSGKRYTSFYDSLVELSSTYTKSMAPIQYSHVEIEPQGTDPYVFRRDADQHVDLVEKRLSRRQHVLNIGACLLLIAFICVSILAKYKQWNFPFYYFTAKQTALAVSGTNFAFAFIGTLSSVLAVAALRRNLAKIIDIRLQQGIAVKEFQDLAKLQTGSYVSAIGTSARTKLWAASLLFTGVLTSSMVSIMSAKQVSYWTPPVDITGQPSCGLDGKAVNDTVGRYLPLLESSEISCYITGQPCPNSHDLLIGDVFSSIARENNPRTGFLTNQVFQPGNGLVSQDLFDYQGACHGLWPCSCAIDDTGLSKSYFAHAVNLKSLIWGPEYLAASLPKLSQGIITSSGISTVTGKYKFANSSKTANIEPGFLELVLNPDNLHIGVLNGGPNTTSAALFKTLTGLPEGGWQAVEYSLGLEWFNNPFVTVTQFAGQLSTELDFGPNTTVPTYHYNLSLSVINSMFSDFQYLIADEGAVLTHALAVSVQQPGVFPATFEGYAADDTIMTYVLDLLLAHGVVGFLDYYNNGVAAWYDTTQIQDLNTIYLLGPQSTLGLYLLIVPGLVLLSVLITYILAARGTATHLDLTDPLTLLLGTNNSNMSTLTKSFADPKSFVDAHAQTMIRTCRNERPGLSVEPVLGIPHYGGMNGEK